MTDNLCVLRHDKPRRALAGTHLCAKHDRDLQDDLRDIELLYALLDDITEPGSVIADELVRYAKRPDPAAPMRLEVAVLRDQRTTWDLNQPDAVSVLAVVTDWATIIREDLRLTAPTEATIASEVGTLRVQHDYATAQPWVDDYAKDIHRAAQALRHVCGEHEGQPVGRCTVQTTGCPGPAMCGCGCHDGTGNPCTLPGGCGTQVLGTCDGPIFPDRYGLMRVRCARCGETWDQDDLRRLGLVLES